MLILYGSQTGNSEDVALRISREAARRHKKTYVCCCDDYDLVRVFNSNIYHQTA